MTPLVCGLRTRVRTWRSKRVVAGERILVGLAAEARPVVGHDRDRRRDDVEDLAGGLVDELELAAIVAQIVDPENALAFGDGGVQARERVRAASGRGDGGCEAAFGGVVDHGADAPDPTAGGLELAEVGLPDPVAHGRRVVEHLSGAARPRTCGRSGTRAAAAARACVELSNAHTCSDCRWPQPKRGGGGPDQPCIR